MWTQRPRWPPGWAATLACTAGGLGALVLVLGITGSPQADAVGLCVSGLPPTVAGVLVGRSTWHSCPNRRLRLLPALAVTTWGLGQVALGVETGLHGFNVDRLPVVAFGDGLSALAAPMALVGLALLPRRTLRSLDRTRTLLDGLLLTTAASLVVWEVSFRDSLAGGLSAAAVPGAVVLLLDLTILAIFVVTAVREMDLGVAVGALGVLAHLGSNSVSVLSPGRPWESSALACVALPLVVAGFSLIGRHALGQPDLHMPRGETRRLVTTASMTAGLLIWLLLAVALREEIEVTPGELRVMVGLAVAFLVVLWAREVLRAQQSQRLLELLSDQARTDPLTGLGNRRALTDSLLQLTRDGEGDVGLLTMDLDGFKDVNSLLGHGTGDALLTGVGDAMQRAARGRPAQAYRLGGDEFAMLVRGPEVETTALADQLLELTRSLGNEIPGVGRVALSASIGIAQAGAAPGEGDDGGPMAALEQSGEAMRASKRTGRGRVTRYTCRLAEAHRRRTAVERRLRAAIADGGLEVHFQPVIHVGTGAVAGLEGLARWRDDELGQVPPVEFIGVAEDCGLMPELGLHLLRVGLDGFVGSGAAARRITLGLNFSTLQLRMPGVAATCIELVAAAGVACERIVVEVTESVLLDEDDPAVTTVYELAASGMPIGLDDFGTGYSSLAYLYRLPVAVLKIDRAMTRSMETDRGLAIVRSIADMGAALGLDVVAEGVETTAQAELVAGLGIPYVQGWLYAPAMTPTALRTYIAERQSLSEFRDDEAALVAAPVLVNPV